MLIERKDECLLFRGKEVGLLNRFISEKRSFYITGMSGVGKTAVLSHCFHSCMSLNKVFIDPLEDSTKEISIKLCKVLEITLSEDKKAKSLSRLQREIFSKKENLSIFIDNYHKLTEKQLIFFLKLNRFCLLYMTSNDKYVKKEKQRELIQGKKFIRLNPILKEDREELAEYILDQVGNYGIYPEELAMKSRGIPRKMWNLAKGIELYRDADDRIDEEEINISFILMAVFSISTAMRYFARGTGEKDLYIVSAIVIALSGLLKIFLQEVNKK